MAESYTSPTMANGAAVDAALANGNAAQAAHADQRIFGFLPAGPIPTLSWDEATWTLTLTGAPFSYYRNSVKYLVATNKSVTLPGTPPASGMWWVRIAGNDGTLSASQTPWTLGPTDSDVTVCNIEINNALTPKSLLYTELHLCDINRGMHRYEHLASGPKLISGGVVSGYTLAGNTTATNTFAVSEAYYLDETLGVTVPALVDDDGATLKYLVRSRLAGAFTWTQSLVPYLYAPGGYIQWDNAGTLTAATAINRYINTYLLATQAGWQLIVGQANHTSLAAAQAETFQSLSLTGLQLAEYIAVAQLTWRTGNYGGLGKCRLEAFAKITVSSITAGNVVGSAAVSVSFTPTETLLATNVQAAIESLDARWSGSANDIGVPGQQGFGVGICPDLPAGYSLMAGTTDPASANYGNYIYQDGSILCWVPAIWVQYTAGEPTDIKPLGYFVDEGAANAAGYVSHRADWDAGVHQPGQFVDKYKCSLGSYGGSPVASSLANGVPLVPAPAASGQVGFAAVGAPAFYYGAINAAKTRGPAFFCNSRAIRAKLALLSVVHGLAATSSTYCAWYDAAGTTNFPKGCNNDALRDINDTSVLYTSAAPAGTYPTAPTTGSGVPFAKTTHNGQACGVADLNGGYYEVELGLTCVASAKTIIGASQANPVAITATSHGYSSGDAVMITGIVGMTQLNDKLYRITVTGPDTFTLDGVDGTLFPAYTGSGTATRGLWYATDTDIAMASYTSGTTLATDHWGATGIAATMSPLALELATTYPNNGFAQRFGGAGATFAGAASGAGWHLDGLGLPQDTGVTAAGSNKYGQDYYYQYARDQLCVISGGYWSVSSAAGAWYAHLDAARTGAGGLVAFRAAAYLPAA